jgi:heat shock protein HslJ/uncharacterized membrane protein
MKKCVQFVAIILLIVSCKSVATAPKLVVQTEPTFAYQQQMENLEKAIYFRGTGNEPDWSLKLSEETIEFTSMKPGFESLSGVLVAPIRAMDANVKRFRVATENGIMSIEIQQQECTNTMSGDKSLYSVRVGITKGNAVDSVNFNGCGSYITDSRLHDIWVLEKLNGGNVSFTDFNKELSNLEINSTTNQFMGFAGCNRMNGIIFFERGLLRFINVITTEMFCGTNNKENDFLKALQSATTYKVENMKLTLSNPLGVELVFKKVD